jgi:hypothetical protein
MLGLKGATPLGDVLVALVALVALVEWLIESIVWLKKRNHVHYLIWNDYPEKLNAPPWSANRANKRTECQQPT